MFAWRDNYISYNGATTGGDPYWNNVSLLLNYEIPQYSLTDISTNNISAVSYTGVLVTPNQRTPFTGAGASVNASGITGYVEMNYSTAFVFGSSSFTVEFWIYPTSLAVLGTMCNLNILAGTDDYGSVRIAYATNGAMYFLCQTAVNTWINTGTSPAGTIATGAWYHIAAVRNGNVFTLYVNGVSKLTYTSASSLLNNSGVAQIGTGGGASIRNSAPGFYSNFRVVIGTAVYTSAFTPPTSPLTAITNTTLLLPFTNQGYRNNLNAITDSGPNAFAISSTNGPIPYSSISPFGTTYPGSARYQTNQYSTVATNAAFTYGTGDFTIEFWVRLTSTSGAQYFIDQRNSGTGNAVIPTIYYTGATGKVYYYVSFNNQIVSTTSLSANTWYAISVCRSGTSTKMFINGVQEGSTYTDTNNYAASRVTIGSQGDTPANYLNGYISNIRLSKGIAYYTSNYTPSTIPLTSSTTYTSLLVTNNTAGIQDLSTYTNTITNTQSTGVNPISGINTQQYKFGTQSYYFQNGTYASIPSTATGFDFGTGDYTIEGWAYLSNVTTLQTLMSKSLAGVPNLGWNIQVNASSKIIYAVDGSTILTSTTSMSTNTWTYFAVSRSGTATYLFFNGNLEATATNSTNLTNTTNLNIGADRNNTTTINAGYLDELRITTGVCRYTASFTAPTSAFPTS